MNARVEQTYVILDSMDDYISALVGLLAGITKEPGEYKVVVFFPAAKLVRFFVNFFTDGLGIRVIELHSRMSQSARQRASAEFRDKPCSILFTSDVSARGVDYPGVTHVIQVRIVCKYPCFELALC
jgi:ATP-dependent RNA helicase MSS116